MLRGDDRPRDIDEWKAIVQDRLDRRHYAAAVELHVLGFRLFPDLSPSRVDLSRDSAIRYAVLAAGPSCRDVDPGDEAARARLRGQALAWLREELGVWSTLIDEDRHWVDPVAPLARWKVDKDLIGVRDPGPLAALPEAERGPWRAAWAEVDRQLQRARASAR